MILVTRIAIASAVLGLVAWDIVVASNNVPGDTISELLRHAGKKALALPFMFGALVGHFWGPEVHYRLNLFASLSILVVLASVAMLFRLFLDQDPPQWAVFMTALAGVLSGVLAWPQ